MKKKDLKPKPSKSAKNKQLTEEEQIILQRVAEEEKLRKKQEKREKKPHYVDPIEFSTQIVESYKHEKLTDNLANSVLKIATRLSYAPNFINYSYRDEMIGDAIIKMLHAIKNKKFDPLLGNAFSYFTRIAFNAFCNRIKKEKKEKEFILNLQDTVYDDMINSGLIKEEYQSEGGYTNDND